MTDWRLVLLGAAAALAVGCSGDPKQPATDAGPQTGDVSVADAGGDLDAGGAHDLGAADDAVHPADVSSDGGADATGAEEMGSGEPLVEAEPNDGAELTEVNELPVAQQIQGTVLASDVDVFHVPTSPGTLYQATLTLPEGSALQGHLTVIDDGRDGDPAGDDYVKISRGGSLRFLGMGEGGYFVIVRDARNVDGAAVGGDDHTYSLVVTEHPVSEVLQGAVNFGSSIGGTLRDAADVHLWSFEGTEGTDVRFDFSTSGDVDGRLWVFSEQTGSWIARQDDRTASDPNPLLDAPLTASGSMLLVVENIDETASALNYTIAASNP